MHTSFRATISAILIPVILFSTISIPQVHAASDVAMTLEISSDGSAAWDSMSFNTGTLANAGFDSDPMNGIVRSLDTISYTWKIRGNVEAPENLTVTHTLPLGVTWTELPLACLTSGVTPLSSLTPDKRTITCNIGDQNVATLYAVTALARVGAGFSNGDSITTSATGSASNGSASAPSNTVDTVVTLGTRIELEKMDDTYSYWNSHHNITAGPNGEPGRVVSYRLGLYLERGSEPPQSGNFQLQDQLRFLSGSSISGAILYTWGTFGPGAECGVHGEGYSSGAYYDIPFGRYGLGDPFQTNENSVPDSGTISCSQPGGPGGDIDISITGADVSLSAYPTTYKYNEWESPDYPIINKFYFGTYVVNIWVPSSTLVAISPYDQTQIQNTITGSGGLPFDPNGLSGNSNFGAGYESTENNTSTGIYLIHNENNIIDPVSNPYPIEAFFDNTISKNDWGRDQTTFAGSGVSIISTSYLRSNYYRSTPLDLITCVKVDPSQVRFNGNTSGSFNPVNIDYPQNNSFVNGTFRLPFLSGGTTVFPFYVEYSTTPFVTNIRDDNCYDADGPWYSTSNTGMLGSGATKIRYKITLPASLSGGMDLFQLYSGEYEVLDRPAGSKIGFFYSQSFDDGATWLNDNNGSINELDNNYAAPTGGPPNWLQARQFADVLTINQATVRIAKDTVPSNTATVFAGNTQEFVLSPSFSGSPGLPNTPQNVIIEDILPDGMSYISGSLALDTGYPQVHVSGSGQLLRWTLSTIPNTPITPIQYTVQIAPMALDNSDLVNITTISNPLDISPIAVRTATDTVRVINTQAFPIYKSTPYTIREVNQTIDFRLQYRNQFLANADTARFIDIFPYNGDAIGLGRESNPSNFTGSLALISYTGTNSEIFRFTNANPATLFDDPCHVNNVPAGANPGDPGADSCMSFLGGSVGVGSVVWCLESEFGNAGCPTSLSTTTAMSVLVPNPIAGFSPIYSVDLTFLTSGNRLNDIYTNSFGGRVENTDLYIRALPVSVSIIASELGDRVWLDDDRDGVQDIGEQGASNLIVTLSGTTLSGSQVNRTTITNSSGNYFFYGLNAGTYNISLSGASGYVATYDLDGTGSVHQAIASIGTGALRYDVDFGIYAVASLGSVGDRIWYDTNADGVQDSGEMGLSGVTLTISGASYSGTTISNNSGEYLFSSVPAGSYDISISGVPVGMNPTYDLDGIGTANLVNLTLSGGENKFDVDFGYRYPLGSVGDRVWEDLNSDGVQNIGENGMSGVTLTLTGTDVLGNSINTTALTNSSGNYLFSGILSGSYSVSTNIGTGYIATYDLDGTGSLGRADFSLGNGENKLNVDFGYRVPPLPATLSGSIWQDADSDGVIDGGESFYSGVTVTISVSGTVVGTGMTDGNGLYAFTGLSAGTYTVTVVNPPSGTNATYDTNGTGTLHTTSETLSAGQNRINVDFGYRVPPPGIGSIGDRVWEDLNSDGVQNIGENGMSGVTVTLSGLTSTGGVVNFSTLTDVSGNYIFNVVYSGSYTVTTSNIGSGYTTTYDLDGIGTPHMISFGLGEGENKLNVDFGYLPPPLPASLAGIVWEDLDSDGVIDVGESFLTGITIELILSGSTLATGTTDTNGAYSFTGLSAGAYSVTVMTPPSGMNQTYDTNGTGTLHTTDEALSAGEDKINVNFGYRTPPPPPASLSGIVWQDADSDGVIDGGESFYSGVTVTISLSGSVVGTGMTDGNGLYAFTGLSAGTYTVTVVNPPSGTNATYDTNGVGTAHTTDETLAAGEDRINVNFGYVVPPPGAMTGSLGDRVWDDANGDGIDNNGETGIPGITITLSGTTSSGSNVTGSVVTDGSGMYIFTDLFSGGYIVTVTTPPSGMNQTYDLDGIGTLGEANVTLSDGQIRYDVDFGYRTPPPPPASLSGTLWEDADSDGVVDPLESTLSGLTVRLTLASTVIATTLSDTNGLYSFTGLSAGTYSVTVTTPPSGMNQTYDTNGTGTFHTTDEVLIAGQDRIEVNFGYVSPAPLPASIAGTIWEDLNSDGVTDVGEPRLSGISVSLSGMTTMTDAGGNYSFTGLSAGIYSVTVTIPPSGMNQTYDTDGTATPNTTSETLSAGQNRVNVNFGYVTPPPPGISTLSLGDQIWNDTDGDGVQDIGEAGFSGLTISLSGTTASGSVTTSTTTSSSGMYNFSNLLPGTYTVSVTMGTGYTATYDLDGTLSLDRATISLIAGQNRTDIDFGYMTTPPPPPPSGNLTGRAWNDADGNMSIGSEPGIPGLLLTLSLSGTTIATTTTDSTGNYSFTGLAGGNYVVTLTPPTNMSPTYDLDGSNTPHRTSALVVVGSTTINVNFGYMSSIVISPPITVPGTGGGGGGSASISSPIFGSLLLSNPTPPTAPIEQTTPLAPPVRAELELDFLKIYPFARGKLDFILPKKLPATGKKKSVGVYTTQSKYLKKYASVDEAPKDIASWTVNLPEQDRNAARYVVIPVAGVISPVNDISEKSPDFSTLVSGQEIKVNPHLKNGVARYPNSALPGTPGNLVIFGHSSYLTGDDGRYKTIFQTLIGMPTGTEVWVYEKRGEGIYERLRYSVDMSYNTKPTDVGVLNPGEGENITLITCTPIGDLTGRWVVKGERIYSNGDKCSFDDGPNRKSGIYYEGACRSSESRYATTGLEKNLYKNFLFHYTRGRIEKAGLIDYMEIKYSGFARINSRLRELMEKMTR